MKMRSLLAIPLLLVLGPFGLAQGDESDQGKQEEAARPSVRPSDPVPRSEAPGSRDKGYSSSRETAIPLDRPPAVVSAPPPSASPGTTGVYELRPYNPHRAMKNVEVGDFYFRRRNYPAALSRYREALEHKPNDAIATFRVAETLERMQEFEEALTYYQAYLKILPNGPLAEDCRQAIERLQPRTTEAKSTAASPIAPD